MNNLLLDNPASHPGDKLFFAKVVRFMPTSNTVDVVTIDDNVSLSDCMVMCPYPVGFSYGSRYFPSYDDVNHEVEYVHNAGDIYCVAAFLENDYNNTVVLGFLFPNETTLSIGEYGLYIFRHESDVMWMVRCDGTMQIYHPSGSIVKIGEDNINEMTSDLDEGGLYSAKSDEFHVRSAADYNESKNSNLFIQWYKGQKVTLDSSGNVIVSTEDTEKNIVTALTMTPDGKVTIVTTEQINLTTKDINVTASGNMTATVDGKVTVAAQDEVDISSATNIKLTAPTIQLIKG